MQAASCACRRVGSRYLQPTSFQEEHSNRLTDKSKWHLHHTSSSTDREVVQHEHQGRLGSAADSGLSIALLVLADVTDDEEQPTVSTQQASHHGVVVLLLPSAVRAPVAPLRVGGHDPHPAARGARCPAARGADRLPRRMYVARIPLLTWLHARACHVHINAIQSLRSLADREATEYLRAVIAAGEQSERALALTAEVIEMNAAHYTAWCVRVPEHV